MSHVNINELDFEKVSLGKKGRNVILVYNTGDELVPLQLNMGQMYLPFGVKMVQNNYSAFMDCQIDCSLNQSNSPVSVACRESLEKLDERVQCLIQDNLDLFKLRDMNIDGMYLPILKENKSYPKLIKLGLPRDNMGNFSMVVFDNLKEKIPLNDDNVETILCKSKVFGSIIECNKVWHYNGKFGVKWNIVQLKFVEQKPRENKTNFNQMMIVE